MHRQRSFLVRKISTAILAGVFILSSCGQSDNLSPETFDSLVDEESETKFTETETKDDEKREPSEDLPTSLEVPANYNAESIHFDSKDGIELPRSIHRCKSDGENIYLVLGDMGLYVMPVGADEASPVSIDIPEGMDIFNLALDTYGQIHLLIVDNDYEGYYIWRIDASYQADKKIDISTYVEDKQFPLWFMVDKDGTYYIQWMIRRNGIIVDSNGGLKHKTTVDSLGTGRIYEAAVGKDGQIYLVHAAGDEQLETSKLNTENGSIENVNPVLSFSGDEVFNLMSGGTDTNLLLFSPYSGVWACDTEKGILENRMSVSDIKEGFADEFWPLVFLPDGRLVLLGQAASASNALLLKYVPVGK
jgi:hypothetical protein